MSAKSRPLLKPVAAAFSRHYGWTALTLLPGLALAGPTGEQVQQGLVAVARPDASTTTVTQGSDNAVVNWHSFSVGSQEYVQFVQPGANAAILNRVVGGNVSDILGRIDANGRVFLVNPQGVYFGAGAKVDTSGFAASALDIDDQDFMNGRYVFTKGSGAPDATIENHGEISADQFVVLMGDRVANEGLIQARLGTVVLAAGEQVTMQLNSSGLISFAVDEATAAAHAGVDNTGEILANGGRVLMTAKVADDLVATAVNNAGLVRAHGVTEDNGEIYLRASGGNAVNSGTLDASGPTGGKVVVHASNDVEIQSGAVISAAGEGSGDGGAIRLIATRTLEVAEGAVVDARGGVDGGSGGTIEVSAHEGELRLEGELSAGAGGHVVVDPARLAINAGASQPGGNSTLATVGKVFIEGLLNTNTDVTLIASDEIFATGGPFTINASGSGALALRIGTALSSPSGELDDAGFYGGCSSLGACLDVGVPNGNFSFAPVTSGSINLSGIGINIAGLFQASAGSASGNVSIGNVQAMEVLINDLNTGLATGNVTTGNLSAPNITISAGGTTGNITVGALSLNAASDDVRLQLDAPGGNININGPTSVVTTSSSGSAQASFDARAVNINGNFNVLANGSGGASGRARIEILADNGITINGNMRAYAEGDLAEIFLSNALSGNITINGGIRADGSSFGSIDIDNDAGNIRITGLLDAIGSEASIAVDGNAVILDGGAMAYAAIGSTGGASYGGTSYGGYGGASIDIHARAALTVNGPIAAKADVGFATVELKGASVLINNVVSADGPGFAGVHVVADGGPIFTQSNGLLKAQVVSLGMTDVSAVAVRTQTPTLYLESYGGGGSPDLAIDNTAHTGQTTVITSTSMSGGTGGSFFLGGDSGSSSFVGIDGGFGATRMLFTGDVDVSGDFAARNAIIDVSSGRLNFHGNVLIGERNLPNSQGDPVSLLALSTARRPDGTRIPLPRFNGVVTAGPNAVFKAATGISFSQGLHFDDPDTPYAVFQTNGKLDLGDGVFSTSSIGNEFLAQFTSYSPNARIYVENVMPLLPASDGPTFTNADHFSKLPGTTMLIGGVGLPTGRQTGSIRIGENGPIDIGNQNILFASTGRILGANRVLSTGFVGELDLIADDIGGFQIPIINEFGDETIAEDEDEKDDDYVDVEGSGGDDSDELVAQKSNNGQMCQ